MATARNVFIALRLVVASNALLLVYVKR